MCAAEPWWPMLFVAAGKNDYDFAERIDSVVAAVLGEYTRYL
jgi:hypothetical protein